MTLELTRADGSVERRLGYRLDSGFVLDGRAYERGAGNARLSAPGEASASRANTGRQALSPATGTGTRASGSAIDRSADGAPAADGATKRRFIHRYCSGDS